MASQEVTKIVVMSDSHGDRTVVEEIKQFYKGKVDAIFHNGDSELPSDDAVWSGIQVVRGNCDYDEGYPDFLVTEVRDVTVAQTHGHLMGLHFGLQKLDFWAQEQAADVCLYGHLHIPAVEVRGETLFLNPGSVSQPRGLVHEKLYAVVTITPSAFEVEFRTLDHERYVPLSTTLPRG